MKIRLCDENCNQCPMINHPNSRMITAVLNRLFDRFGDDVYTTINELCPNFTVCYDCRIDDFCHLESCEIVKE